MGPKFGEFATRLLDGPFPWSRLRQAQKLLRLAERYTPDRLESACARALAFDLLDVKRVERILVEAIDKSADTNDVSTANVVAAGRPPARFARPGSAFARRPDPADVVAWAELAAVGGSVR